MGVTLEALVFRLGSLISPKDMLREVIPGHKESECSELRSGIQISDPTARSIVKVY